MLRLAFDAKRVFTNFTGLGNYSRTLLRNLSYYYPDFAYFLYTPAIVRHPETRIFLNSPLFSVHYPRQWERPLWKKQKLGRLVNKHKIDLFHGLTNELPAALDRKSCCQVVTIHDLAFKQHPEFVSLPKRLQLESQVSHAIRQADHIVVPSRSTRNDVRRHYAVPESRLSVIYQSCSERFLQEKSAALLQEVINRYRLPDTYLLFVGALTARKNLIGVLEMLRQFVPSERPPLVVVGTGKAYEKKALRYLQKHQLQKWVHFVQPDFDDLPALFQKASVFVYPSLYEGFGIPVLEALFSKTPVVTAQTTALPEVAGPSALLIDPQDPEAMKAAVVQFLSDDAFRQKAIETGYQYAQRFRGEPVSEKLVDLYRDLLGADDLEGAEL